MRTKPFVLAVLAASVLLVGAAGAATAQPGDAGQDGDAGPPDSLPEPVPDFVSDVLGAIGDFLSGSLDGLGEAVSDLTPGGGADERADE
jgi:hypothetical protein